MATLAVTALGLALIAAVLVGAAVMDPAALRTDLLARSQPPSLAHPFGTDPLGRDSFLRTVSGLALSFWIGALAASISALIALALALGAAVLGRKADAVVSLLVDMGLGLPHLVLLILVSFTLGGGRGAVVIAVAVTHWPRLTRILRAEIFQVMQSDYVRLSRRFGQSWGFIARRHLVPHALPQLLTGTLLLFPHAILHEAGLTFLGFGLEPNTPAIGVMLAESMRYLTSGAWWLGVFPGLSLVALVLCLDRVGSGLQAVVSPRESQE